MPTFVLVGHCGPDQFMLRNAVQRAVPDAAVVIVNDAGVLAEHLNDDTVLLVNRELDGRFDVRGGIDLIDALDDGPRAMLISNFPEAQAQARAAGALPGFGKSDLYDEATAEMLRGAWDL